MATPPGKLPPRERGQRAVELVREGAFQSATADEIYGRLLDIFTLLRRHEVDFGGPAGTWEAVRTYVDAILAHYRADVQFIANLEALSVRSTRGKVRRAAPSLDQVFHFPPGTIDALPPTDVGRIAGIVVEELAPDLSSAVPLPFRTQRAPELEFPVDELRRIVHEELTRRPPSVELRREGGIVFRAGEVPGAFAPEPAEELPLPPPTPANEAAEVAQPPSAPTPNAPQFPSAAAVATYSRRELEALYRQFSQLEKKGIVVPPDVRTSADRRWVAVFHFPPPGGAPAPARVPSPPAPTPPPPAQHELRMPVEQPLVPSAPPSLKTLTAEALRPPYLGDFVTYPLITRTLEGDVRSRNFSRCYIFYGPPGLGKTSIAEALVRTYLRDEGMRIGVPDLGAPGVSLSAQGVTIFGPEAMSKGQVAFVDSTVIPALRTRPMGGAVGLHRWIILDDVSQLSPEAQQHLLRPLEAVSGRASVVFTANDTSKLLPALKSRCAARSFEFHPLRVEDIDRALEALAARAHVENPDVPRLAHLAAERSGGDLRAAVDMFLSDLREAGIS
ncbi:MAG: AAA family ATPase [Thermoplasmata archaeon]